MLKPLNGSTSQVTLGISPVYKQPLSCFVQLTSCSSSSIWHSLFWSVIGTQLPRVPLCVGFHQNVAPALMESSLSLRERHIHTHSEQWWPYLCNLHFNLTAQGSSPLSCTSENTEAEPPGPRLFIIQCRKFNMVLPQAKLLSCCALLYIGLFFIFSDVHNAEFILTGVLTQTLDYESYPFMC